MMRFYWKLTSQPGDYVVDAFCGSASAGVAAVLEGRKVLCIDKHPHAIELSTFRLERLKAEAETGTSSDEPNKLW